MIRTGQEVKIDVAGPGLKVVDSQEGAIELRGLGDVSEIMEAGGLFGYAQKMGMIS